MFSTLGIRAQLSLRFTCLAKANVNYCSSTHSYKESPWTWKTFYPRWTGKRDEFDEPSCCMFFKSWSANILIPFMRHSVHLHAHLNWAFSKTGASNLIRIGAFIPDYMLLKKLYYWMKCIWVSGAMWRYALFYVGMLLVGLEWPTDRKQMVVTMKQTE